MTRSVSQTEQYEKCGHQFFLRRVEGVIPRPAAWSHQGTAFHSACEVYERGGRQLSAGDVVDLFSTEYSEAVNGALEQEPDLDHWMTAGPDGASDIEARYVLGQQQAAGYVSWAKAHGPELWKAPDGTPGIELHLTADIAGIKVQGYIDQLVAEPDGSVRIRDLKTGTTKSKFQLQTYAVLVRKALGLKVAVGDWYQAKKNGLTRPLDLSGVTEEEVGAKYVEIDQGVKRADFPAKPGFNCRFCDVSYACSFRRR
ncbi:RecB family exonuclease [Streptomyces sp. H27-H5]|uniref:RecB family exonuclease n=1 Tax=Streptomyces sp. H27-H5 TaxID=2996460 RepID=UPI0022718875|nr:PD-(D/E)XK nuclease family protein [Streptomyces sp. H27-H5]MCY0963014.1 PD-(D/E)XK nuclease family protein [Streptomyces sp. H27-H5]